MKSSIRHKRIKVLVTGVGGCTVGEGILKALKAANKYDVYGTDIEPLSPGLFHVKKGFIVPKAKDSEYLDSITQICKKNKIDILIPGSDFENQVWAKYKYTIKDFTILTNDPEVVSIGSDGWLTYCFLKENGFQCPETTLFPGLEKFIKKYKFPLILKPRFSQGSHYVYTAQNVEELNTYLKIHRRVDVESLIQQHIGMPDEEYTIGITTSQSGKTLSIVALKRTLIAGASFKMYPVDDIHLNEIAIKLSTSIGSRGALNFQARKHNGSYYIFEINPRFSGTTPVRCGLGVNEPDILIQESVSKYPMKFHKTNNNFVVCRVFQEIYIPMENYNQLKRQKSTVAKAKSFDYI